MQPAPISAPASTRNPGALLFLLPTVRRLSIAKQINEDQPDNAIRDKSSASQRRASRLTARLLNAASKLHSIAADRPTDKLYLDVPARNVEWEDRSGYARAISACSTCWCDPLHHSHSTSDLAIVLSTVALSSASSFETAHLRITMPLLSDHRARAPVRRAREWNKIAF
jgi:hypothetical protein